MSHRERALVSMFVLASIFSSSLLWYKGRPNADVTTVIGASGGLIDTTFGIDGTVTYTDRYFAGATTTMGNGNIVVNDFRNQVVNSEYDEVVRLTAAGDIDLTFNEGVVLPDYPTDEYSPFISTYATQIINGEEKLLVLGVRNAKDEMSPLTEAHSFQLYRYHYNGQLDTSFGTNGVIFFPRTLNLRDIEIQADNKIVLVGSVKKEHTTVSDTGDVTVGQSENLYFTRYDQDGQAVDTDFGVDGVQTVEFQAGSMEFVQDVITVGNYGIATLSTGFKYSPETFTSTTNLNIARLNPDGSLVSTFADSGKFSYSMDELHHRYASPLDLYAEDDGTLRLITRLGYHSDYEELKFTTIDRLGSLFTSAYAELAGDQRFYPYESLRLSDGRFITIGQNFSDKRVVLAAFMANGDPDLSFGTNGQTHLLEGEENVWTDALIRQNYTDTEGDLRERLVLIYGTNKGENYHLLGLTTDGSGVVLPTPTPSETSISPSETPQSPTTSQAPTTSVTPTTSPTTTPTPVVTTTSIPTPVASTPASIPVVTSVAPSLVVKTIAPTTAVPIPVPTVVVTTAPTAVAAPQPVAVPETNPVAPVALPSVNTSPLASIATTTETPQKIEERRPEPETPKEPAVIRLAQATSVTEAEALKGEAINDANLRFVVADRNANNRYNDVLAQELAKGKKAKVAKSTATKAKNAVLKIAKAEKNKELKEINKKFIQKKKEFTKPKGKKK